MKMVKKRLSLRKKILLKNKIVIALIKKNFYKNNNYILNLIN